MKIGFAQFAPVLGEPETNRRTLDRLAAQAHGADLLVFPELASSGYRFRDRAEAWALSESAAGGPFVRHLTAISAKHRMFVVAGFCERDGERLYNSAALAGPAGVIGIYRKTHLFMDEKDIFLPGDLGLPVFDADLGALDPSRSGSACRIGLLICFDWQFPEVWRVLALKGADVVCHPSNLVLPGKAQRAVPTHAMLNRVFAVLANRTGTERDLAFTGRSILAGPSGETLAEGSPEGEEVHVVEVDPAEARDKKVTARNDLIADRRPELYKDIVRGA